MAGALCPNRRVRGERARTSGRDIAPSALALTRKESSSEEVLERVPVDPRGWRDLINFILGLNEGVVSQRERRARRGLGSRADEVYFKGNIEVARQAVETVEAALREARRHDKEVGPGHILAHCSRGPGDIAAGTAKYHGVTLAKARAAAGIPHERRVLAAGAARATGPRPAAIGPLVPLRGGYTPRAAIEVALRQAAWRHQDDMSAVQVVGGNTRSAPFLCRPTGSRLRLLAASLRSERPFAARRSV